MKKALTIAVATMALTGVLLAGATSAVATPTKKISCSKCHAPSTAVVLTVTPVKNAATTVTYKIKITGGKGRAAWAVLSGGKNLAHAFSASGTFKAKKGTVITVWAVKKGTGSADTTITVN
jgi:hypothetical protein